MRILFLFVSCLMSTFSVTAQAILWNGGNGNWNVPANWDCVCVPGVSDSVTIQSGAVTIPAGFPVFSELITVGVSGSLINHDTLSIANAGAAGLVIEGSFENHGKLVITEALNAGLSIKSAGIVTNLGMLEIDSVDATGISMEGSVERPGPSDGRLHLYPIRAWFPSFQIYDFIFKCNNPTGRWPMLSQGLIRRIIDKCRGIASHQVRIFTGLRLAFQVREVFCLLHSYSCSAGKSLRYVSFSFFFKGQ